MKTISRKDYLALVGLLELARRHNVALREIGGHVRGIVGEDQSDYSGDQIFSTEPDADELLSRLGIAVEPDADPAVRVNP
jgi:hypothetical protein